MYICLFWLFAILTEWGKVSKRIVTVKLNNDTHKPHSDIMAEHHR